VPPARPEHPATPSIPSCSSGDKGPSDHATHHSLSPVHGRCGGTAVQLPHQYQRHRHPGSRDRTRHDTHDDRPTPSSTGGSDSGSPTASASPSPSAATGTKTYTGTAASTRWGDVQVAITVTNGRITDVQVPVYPDGNGRDQEINAYALPTLRQETLDAQSADIDAVSGATVTSDGYLQSLRSALDAAHLS